MARAFGRDTPVLQPALRHHGRGMWLLWPALQYRVVTPIMEQPELNVFQRGILDLARCGKRKPTDWAELLGLEPEFVQLVRDGLRTMRYLDAFEGPTDAGLRALDDGFLDPTRVVVTHVYQDPFTGAVWPAYVDTPVAVSTRWIGKYKAKLEVPGGSGPATVTAIEVPCTNLGKVGPPSAGDIIEQVSRGRRIGVWGEHGARWNRRAPGRVVARVSVLNAGEPVYLPVQVAAEKTSDNGRTWVAVNPFTGNAYERLRRSILNRSGSHEILREALHRLVGHSSVAHLSEYDRMKEDRKRRYRAQFEVRFGTRLRDHQEIEELLAMVEFHWENARSGTSPEVDLEQTAHYAWRVHEVILRRLPERWQVPTWPAEIPGGTPPWRKIIPICERIGLSHNEYRNLWKFTSNSSVTKAVAEFGRNGDPKVPDLMLIAVLSADAHGLDHPIRQLIRSHPNLLTEWHEASGARNRGSHGEIEQTPAIRARAARDLAFDLTECLMTALHQTDEEKEPPAHGQESEPPPTNPSAAAPRAAIGAGGP